MTSCTTCSYNLENEWYYYTKTEIVYRLKLNIKWIDAMDSSSYIIVCLLNSFRLPKNLLNQHSRQETNKTNLKLHHHFLKRKFILKSIDTDY